MKNIAHNIKNALKRKLAKKAASFLIKKLMVLLAPLIPVLLILLISIFLAVTLFAAFFGAMPKQQTLTSVKANAQDSKIYAQAEELVSEKNVEQTWLKGPDGNTHLGFLADYYGSDVKLINKWGDIYSPVLFKASENPNKNLLQDESWLTKNLEYTADTLKPYFYYKKSQIIYHTEDGDEVVEIYLLTEADTIRGQYVYEYKWIDTPKKSYERLENIRMVREWDRLEEFLKKYLALPDQKQTTTARQMVFEAGQGFTARKEWFDWLQNKFGGGFGWVSSAMVPAELKPYFLEAEKQFGIPWWFLAAIAMKESSFNPTVSGFDGTGSYGLMQALPENWRKYSAILGFDPVADKNNPRAQILVGAYMLSSYGVKVNWGGDNWQEESLPMLVAYNAGPGNIGNHKMEEYVKKNYAELVWQYAEQFKAPTITWPLRGYTQIISHFGMRRPHPILGVTRPHYGIDIPAPTGTSVYSVSGGVAYTGYEADGFGKYIIVKDGIYEYWYAHLSVIGVKNGQKITPGTVIGKVGSTGLSEGPHLHLGIKPIGGNWIDPELVLKQMK
ncbi:peptidoglycan DD-metalloendopeptidase family protein [Desulfotomaculum nigrificans]|uniref:peptidoglycan DD-metalloendopeptidase family protein n=1 Tax=Desulfotomaculum nigrificans TaxID=1565 RepID=UPI0001FAEB29|nr:peptidoglycan DD-metalloendopeptidase family protein [Desulfotomaculum nigrificans]